MYTDVIFTNVLENLGAVLHMVLPMSAKQLLKEGGEKHSFLDPLHKEPFPFPAMSNAINKLTHFHLAQN